MSEELLVRHCSPTLAGMKTGSIFNCSYADDAQMRDSLRRFNRLLRKKGLRILPLRYRNHRALIYVYRPSQLSRDLRRDSARKVRLPYGNAGILPDPFDKTSENGRRVPSRDWSVSWLSSGRCGWIH